MMLSMTLKMAVEAPIPKASVMIATVANPGVFLRFLNAYRMSCPSVSMMNPLPLRRLPKPGATCYLDLRTRGHNVRRRQAQKVPRANQALQVELNGLRPHVIVWKT